MTVDVKKLEILFSDFVQFVKEQTGENFSSFESSTYIEKEENYKKAIVNEAKAKRGQASWTEADIGTGRIQNKMNLAIQSRVHYRYQWHDNNLVNWRKKDDFAKMQDSKTLERLLFDFYKNKTRDSVAFDELIALKLSYQFVAYLFFIKDSEKYLPITQERFDHVFDLIGLEGFKTSGRASWDNYAEFIDINKQVREFLKRKDSKATLIDAHSFLYILGSQMKKANFSFSKGLQVEQSNLVQTPDAASVFGNKSEESGIVDDDEEMSFLEGKEKYHLHKSKERNRELVRIAKELHLKKDEKLRCQVCRFSFVEIYGDIGFGFIEAHHIFPISELVEETPTKVEDLALVCSNCHRMLHRKRPWAATLEELRELRSQNK